MSMYKTLKLVKLRVECRISFVFITFRALDALSLIQKKKINLYVVESVLNNWLYDSK
jgi:hypothetical protein